MFRLNAISALILGCLFAIGCVGSAGKSSRGKPVRPDNELGIKIELSVEPKAMSRSSRKQIAVRIFITNIRDEALSVEFDTSNYYDLFAIDSAGRRYRLSQEGENIIMTLNLAPHETKLFEFGWDGNTWSGRKIVFLPYGEYELEALVKNAASNTEFVELRE